MVKRVKNDVKTMGCDVNGLLAEAAVSLNAYVLV